MTYRASRMPAVTGTPAPVAFQPFFQPLAIGLIVTSAALLTGIPLRAGTYTNYNGGTGPDTPVSVASITRWATTVVDYSPAPGVGPTFRNPAAASGFFSLGDLYSTTLQPVVGTEPSPFHAGNGVANLHPYGGNVNDSTDTYGFIGIDAPGSVTFSYGQGIFNGPGADLGIRENGFGSGAGFFAELAFVEVSSNGVDFARFPSISQNTAPTSTIGTFQYYDMTNVYNLAGKHASNLATPFDLDDLLSDSMVLGGTVDLANIIYIRLVDVVGNPASSGLAGALDSQGNRILDNWTTFDSGGFDIPIAGGLPQVVGVLHAVPEPASSGLILSAAWLCFRRKRAKTVG